ncbi:MAG: hypothetical protein LAN71_17255, partial [Acidobacteriia bacterium]|nr:hypothetical protein [Terriglobia bacterium]
KMSEFEKNNPEKIKKWKKEDEERQMDWFLCKRSGIFGKVDNGNGKEIKEILRICLKYSPNKFVFSVSEQFIKNGRISDKQLQVLINIAKKYNVK